jgi:serine/threonine protein phosphatase PrpC
LPGSFVQEYGTTAVVCVQKGELLMIANVGDSKAILFRETAQVASSLKKYEVPHQYRGVELRLSFVCPISNALPRRAPGSRR